MRYYVAQLLQPLPLLKMQAPDVFNHSNYSYCLPKFVSDFTQSQKASAVALQDLILLSPLTVMDLQTEYRYVAAVPTSLPPALSTRLKPALQLHLHSRAGEMNVLIANR